ncbi:tRNA-2-methylthio-N(6)-dimethylallyladenosine synthase [Frankliniella fusca]|uniref:tRNA-2-methylthio-N(6)-dimethylallyladenosine synthase n=1 Tax=Frankliniella fusca TaxID=407009 RepID=A0AAE1HGZ8_9NEOP|nr:tRNA-2-methylthio-N(6)-dimethylallyladenosine synthase [Frankliniella fusca]
MIRHGGRRGELQTLQEENRRLQTGAGGPAGPGRPSSVLLQPDTADMVDTVLLQNQVDTLQWQLRQTENSRHMYRAVMEQVVRFLERAHRNLKLASGAGAGAGPRPKTPNGRVPRSRSVHTVDVCPGRASPRDSLPDFQRAKSITQIEDSQSYSAFRDFTWRRPRPSQSDLEEVPPEKLSQEAFRLLRTVQSLLNTREPDLAHRLSGSGSGSASGSGDSEARSEPRSERSSVVSLDHPDDSSQTSPTPTANGSVKDGAGPHGDRLVADVAGALRRKLNIRNSQVVSCASYNRLREFASESNSNSSTAEDCDFDTGPASLLSGLESAFSGSHHGHGHHHRLEEARQALRKEEAERDRDRLLHRNHHAPPTPQPSLSSAEDESGFSSMGSFQEVGLPLLSSTQLNGTSDPPALAASTTWHNVSTASSSCRTSASPARSHGSFHEVGLPVPVSASRQHHGKPPVPIHRRWSSNPVEAIARSAYKGTEALRVLWV